MKTVRFYRACLILGLCLVLPRPAASQATVTFNFDTGTPVLTLGQSTPFDQTSGGLTAPFSSPSGAAYSVQSEATTHWRLPRFSSNYLNDNDLTRSVLSIKFTQALNSITLTFATPDFEIEVPSTIQLTAYLDSNATPVVGSASEHGTYVAGDTMPMGTLSFNSGGQPFNLAEIVVPPQTGGATAFLVDNITVATATLPARTVHTAEAAYLSAIPANGADPAIRGGQGGRHAEGCPPGAAAGFSAGAPVSIRLSERLAPRFPPSTPSSVVTPPILLSTPATGFSRSWRRLFVHQT